MEVFKVEFECGDWCYIFAESEDCAWEHFIDVMDESYSIKEFKEVGKTIAGIVYINSGVSKKGNTQNQYDWLSISRQERTGRWYEIIWVRVFRHCWWKLIHSIKYFERKEEKEIMELFKDYNTQVNQSEYGKDNHSD